MTEFAKHAVKIINEKAPGFKPELALVLGSGLGKLADSIENATVISYNDLPGFPACSVEGHGSKLFLGELSGVKVACMQGRGHFYEGVGYDIIKTPMRTLKLLGCDTVILTNSAGSMRSEVKPGSLVVIKDHINFLFHNPLVGPNEDEFGPRFIGMDDVYNTDLRKKIHNIGKDLNIELTDGVYFGVIGPSFETPAEIRAFKTLGGDVVGMSTIPEVITAHHCGLRVAAISVITNMAAGMSDEKLTHEGTLNGAALATDKLIQLMQKFIKSYK